MNDSLRNTRIQLVFWITLFVLFILVVTFLGDILLPFIAGMLLAYFLDPLVDKFESFGLPRLLSVLILVLIFLGLFVLALFWVLPLAYEQLLSFISVLPSYIDRLRTFFSEHELFGRLLTTDGDADTFLRDGISWLGSFVTSLWSSGGTLLSVLSLLVVTPIVAFYMLLDWDRMVEKIDSLLPRQHRSVIRELIGEMDDSVSGFVRGQGTVCLILGIFYAISLTLAGLDFGLLIGILSGLISFVPFIGALLGLVVSLGVAFIQFWPDYIPILIIAAIFGFGQFVEGNILQPNLVGRRIGLHPVWLIFSLSAFGSLFGFVGLLIAVPLASVFSVLVRFALRRYMSSPFYDG